MNYHEISGGGDHMKIALMNPLTNELQKSVIQLGKGYQETNAEVCTLLHDLANKGKSESTSVINIYFVAHELTIHGIDFTIE